MNGQNLNQNVHIISMEKIVYEVLDTYSVRLKKLDAPQDVTQTDDITQICTKFYEELGVLNRAINKINKELKTVGNINDSITLRRKLRKLVNKRVRLIGAMFNVRLKHKQTQYDKKPTLLMQFYYDLEQIVKTVLLDRIELNVIAAVRRPPSGIEDYPSGNENVYGIAFDNVKEMITQNCTFKDIVGYARDVMGVDTWHTWSICKINGMYILEDHGDYRILEWYADHWVNGKYVSNPWENDELTNSDNTAYEVSPSRVHRHNESCIPYMDYALDDDLFLIEKK